MYPERQIEVYEILERVGKETKRQEKINILQKHKDITALKDVCRGFFDDVVQWNLPPGKPPYEPCTEESVPSTLRKQNQQFRYFVKGGQGDRLPAFKREKIFIGVLESIHPADAEIVISMTNKKPTTKGFTKKLVQEAFPDLIVK
jgi:hypothetical protein